MAHICDNELIKKRVMRRVYTMWMCRTITSPMALKLIALFAVATYARAYVSYKDVLVNSPSFFDFEPSFWFWYTAFVKTDAITQFFMIGITVLFAWLVYDFVRRMAAGSRMIVINNSRGVV